MTRRNLLYQPWTIRGSYFNRMLHCGNYYNQRVQNALMYLPRDTMEAHKERLAFVAMGHRDGCRLARALCENREIIILSERILPKRGAKEDKPDVRYFIYVVLHEVVHAIKNHRSPLYDSLTPEEVNAQEAEADDLALSWFNDHIAALRNPYLLALTREEVNEAQAKSRTAMEDLYYGA